MGKLIGIATRTKTKAPMDVHSSAEVTFEKGVLNDSRGKKVGGKRQVTVMSIESWDAVCVELNTQLNWTTRRANFLVSGIPLLETTGNTLRIGSVQLEITGELVPCNRMDEQFEGLTNSLSKNWRGGVTCKVLKEGQADLNDLVELID